MKKINLIPILLGTALALSACSSPEQKEEPKAKQEQKENTKKPAVTDKNAVDKSDTAKNDDQLKKEIEKDKALSNVHLIITEDGGGYAMLDFEVDSKMAKEEAKKLTDQYANKLQEKYKDRNIDVQARKDGQSVAQTTIPFKK